MSGLKHNYSAGTVPDKVLKLLEEKNLPFTASKMALMLDVAYSSCYAVLQLQESGILKKPSLSVRAPTLVLVPKVLSDHWQEVCRRRLPLENQPERI